MPPTRHSIVPNLNLSAAFDKAGKNNASPLTPGATSSEGQSSLTPHSPKSSPSSPLTKGTTIRPVTQQSNIRPDESPNPPLTPSLTAIPPYPPSPKDSPKHSRDASRSFFLNLKASKSSHRIHTSDGLGTSGDNKSRSSSKDRSIYGSRSHGSTPDLLSSTTDLSERKKSEDSEDRSAEQDSKKAALEPDQARAVTAKKSKPRFPNFLTRSRSVKVDESCGPTLIRRPTTGLSKVEENTKQEAEGPPKTAPSNQDRAVKEGGNAIVRNRSADRPTENGGAAGRKEKTYGPALVASASLSQVSEASAALFNNIKQSSTEAADRIGKAGKGLFGKITRSGSTNEREPVTDDNYVCSVINLPLIEQTRRTRISKRLEDCKDKTEFWMPALPYRCIDYLNFRGCEEEGLYRVPGSGKEVKHWQRRFDTELDINLFDEPDLYDINTIGSMFKAWLRELPDELFPKETQARIAAECEGATTVPQMLKDELSKLPPYNYYLLFAITCHLNLLHSYVDQNKMDYRNLCICFQPCMKIDGFCFQFLVCDWKNCWQGCWTEKEWLKKEMEAEQALAHSSAFNDRAISSSSSSEPGRPDEASRRPESRKGRKKPPKKLESSQTSSSHTRTPSQLPELGPPLSPIKI